MTTVTDIIMIDPVHDKSQSNKSKASSKWTVHVEVRLRPRTATRFDSIRNSVHAFLQNFDRLSLPSVLDGWQDVPELSSSVDRIYVCESACPSHTLALDDMALQIHIYQPSDSDSFEEFSNSAGVRDDDDDTMAASVCELPNRTWEGLWDSLIYADDIKLKLLDYIHATLLLSDANVDCGYTNARLLEINAHSLFSKWFSESGKLVQRLFNSITELVDEEDAFLVVLIDEVESLTAARASAMAGTEPSDGLRVVNALLTQLDKLKHRKNVLIMSTSNLVKAIDSAFIDRADIVQYIDLPSREAIYEILRTCLCEMTKKGIVASVFLCDETVPTLRQAQILETTTKTISTATSTNEDEHSRSKSLALRLLALAGQCRTHNLSGRALRRLPVLALARYIGLGNVPSLGNDSSAKRTSGADVDVWLDGMEKIVQEQTHALQRLN
ncbi:hypothetical protein H0H93_008313 [Arthromyces matolae]|nr:hypothetical protein H0H93_008313 [Arthromyces matolae]